MGVQTGTYTFEQTVPFQQIGNRRHNMLEHADHVPVVLVLVIVLGVASVCFELQPIAR